MFRCEQCEKLVPSSSPEHKVVVAVRPVVHPFREASHRRRIKRKRKLVSDRGGTGTEIAQELRCCASCAAQAGRLEPRQEAARPPRRRRQAVLDEQLYGARPGDDATRSTWTDLLPKKKRASFD